jgi:hypothetical protein
MNSSCPSSNLMDLSSSRNIWRLTCGKAFLSSTPYSRLSTSQGDLLSSRNRCPAQHLNTRTGRRHRNIPCIMPNIRRWILLCLTSFLLCRNRSRTTRTQAQPRRSPWRIHILRFSQLGSPTELSQSRILSEPITKSVGDRIHQRKAKDRFKETVTVVG